MNLYYNNKLWLLACACWYSRGLYNKIMLCKWIPAFYLAVFCGQLFIIYSLFFLQIILGRSGYRSCWTILWHACIDLFAIWNLISVNVIGDAPGRPCNDKISGNHLMSCMRSQSFWSPVMWWLHYNSRTIC